MARSGDPSGSTYADMTVGDYANGMPDIRLGEMFKSLLRQMIWVIPLFVIGVAIAFYATRGIERTYEGHGRLLVQLGSEYVYQSVSSDTAGQGLLMTPDSITLNETAIMKNDEVIEQVIGEMVSEFGENRFAPDAFRKINAARRSGDAAALADAKVELQKMVSDNYVVMPQPKSSVVDVVYKHEDGEIAVATLNAMINAYLSYRRTIFVEGSGDAIADRRMTTEEQLDKNEAAISAFLRRNGISDFESEREGATERTEDLRAQLNTIRANMAETEAALATVETQLRQTPAEINLYVDDRAAQRVAQAELELKQLLAKYLPSSDPVRAKRAEIEQLKSLQSDNGGQAVGGRRVGPNTVYQELLARRNTLQSTADSYREREFTVQRLLNAADAKVQKLQRLSPEYSNLLRERSTLDTRLKGYTNQEQEALVNQQQAAADSENVRVISYASLPRKGRNMQKIIFALASAGWGFTLFMMALLAVFLDPKLYRKSAVSGDRAARLAPSARPYRDYSDPVYMPSQPEAQPAPPPAAADIVPSPAPAPSYAPPPYPKPYEPAAASTASAYGSGSAAPIIGRLPPREYG